jgi:hypothetical protein
MKEVATMGGTTEDLCQQALTYLVPAELSNIIL